MLSLTTITITIKERARCPIKFSSCNIKSVQVAADVPDVNLTVSDSGRRENVTQSVSNKLSRSSLDRLDKER